MDKLLEIYKGAHPGIALERELRQRRLKKGKFAMEVEEYPQTLSAILAGKRNMNTALAMRIEEKLGWEEGLLMSLQIFYEIKEEKKKRSKTNRPDLSKIRPALFWDTIIENIDWQTQKRAVIERVFERGNEKERNEMIRFYGHGTIDDILKH
jgi:antitoxin HigA-1